MDTRKLLTFLASLIMRVILNLECLGVDLRYIEGSEYNGPELTSFDDGSSKNIWGVRRKTVSIDQGLPEKGTCKHVMDKPLTRAESFGGAVRSSTRISAPNHVKPSLQVKTRRQLMNSIIR